MRWDPPSSAVLSPSPRRRGSREEVMDPSMLSELESTTRASRRRLSHDPSSHALKSRPSSPAPRDASPGKPPSSAWVISGFRVHFIQVRCPHPTPPWASLVAQRVKKLPAVWRPGFHPWVGKIPWRRAWPPTPALLPGESPCTEQPGGLQSTRSQRHA